MTISVGTYDDLKGRNEPQPIDRNPDVPCTVCGDVEYSWSEWQERYDEYPPFGCEVWGRILFWVEEGLTR